MSFPPWLQYTRLENEADETDVSGIQLEAPPSNLETLPALSLAFECAKLSLLTTTGYAALASSFDEEITPSDVRNALDQTKVYVAKWIRAARDAFHVPLSTKPENIDTGNVFLKFDVSTFFG